MFVSSSSNAVHESRSPEAVGASARRDWTTAIVVALLVLTLAPRAVLAWRLDCLPSDGVYHVNAAQMYAEGDYAGAQRDGLNVYPLILWGLHSCGLDWFTAAKLWGVLASTLVVLPLFGWVRAEFGQTTAGWACLLYAVNPKLIEWSPEPLRDSTFWLAMATCVYFGRRAVRDGSLACFVAAGLSWAVAVHTRFEGWFLTVPLVLWTAHAAYSNREQSLRLLTHAGIGALMLPALVLVFNLAFPSGAWQSSTSGPAKLALRWIGLYRTTTPEALATQATPHHTLTFTLEASDDASAATQRKLRFGALSFLTTKVVKGIGAAFGLLLLAGLVVGRRRLLEFDQLALLLVPLMTVAGMALVLWYRGDSSSRYVASIVVLATPYAALGAQAVAAWLASGFTWLTINLHAARESHRHALPAAGVLLGVTVAAIGLGDSLLTDYDDRRAWSELGRRIGAEFGPGVSLVSCGPRQIAFYAEARATECRARALTNHAASGEARLIVVNLVELNGVQRAAFEAARVAAGYRAADEFSVRFGVDDVRVFVRDDAVRLARDSASPESMVH